MIPKWGQFVKGYFKKENKTFVFSPMDTESLLDGQEVLTYNSSKL